MKTYAEQLARRASFTITASDGHTVWSINAAEASRPQDLRSRRPSHGR